ncbi:hypothetical protein BaRGS_00016055, partial [Batillaria attramentaria]
MAKICLSAVIIAAVAVSLIPHSSCFQWTTSSPADGAVIQACIREKVSFPWEFSTSADEILDNVQWHKRTGNEDTLIAMYAADIFLPIAPVEFLPNAGITISNHTFEDFGTFSVKVIYRQQETLFSVSRSAVLELPDAPVINGNRLMAHVQREPVTNVTTGEKHVQLTCGKFLGLGSRPVSVVWRLQGELLLQEKTDEKIKTELKRQEDVDTNLKLRDVNLTSEVADLRQDLASDVSSLRTDVNQLQSQTSQLESHLEQTQTNWTSDIQDLQESIEELTSHHSCQAAGWVGFQTSCYKLVKNATTWASAKKYCQALHGKLAEIGSEEENEFVEQLARQGGRSVWLGGTDAESEGSWVWDSSGNALQFKNWITGEPNNGGNEDCLHMWVSHDYKWNDIVCDNEMYFVCEESLASHMLRYENLQDAKMNKLEDHCKSLDGKLAEIESLEENEFVKQLARQGESAWLGGHDPESDGSWVWDVSGNSIPLQSGDWLEGQPSGNGICLQLWKAHNYTWDDVDCDYKLQFVCEI